MHKFLFVLFLLALKLGHCQEGPFNKYKFLKLTDNSVIEHEDSIEALIYEFSGNSSDNFIHSIEANRQLKEVQLLNPPEEAIQQLLNADILPGLHTVFIFGFDQEELNLSPRAGLKHVWIYSEKLKSFRMISDSIARLEQLQLSMPELVDLKVNPALNKLDYLELIAPKLTTFPLTEMKKIGWLTVYCSFDHLPEVFCKLDQLQLFTYSNY